MKGLTSLNQGSCVNELFGQTVEQILTVLENEVSCRKENYVLIS